MEELNGKCVNVVLAIETGRGMPYLEYPIKIVANFYGRPLETDLVNPDENVAFNTELVWEIEKKELRKIRTKNIPLRLEVLLVDNNSRKDRIGFILLSTRSANIIPHNYQTEIPFKWCKLLGVQAEHKRGHPELYISLTIRDLASSDDQLPYSEELSCSYAEEPFYMDGELVPFQYLPDGYIQIGNESCTQKYLLTIIIQVAYNLNLLLPVDPNQAGTKYFMSFDMFGITIKSKSFSRDLHDYIPMNEKIIVRIRSEYQIIRTYLSNYCKIFVSFYNECEKLGATKLNVETLLGNIGEDEFITADYSVLCEEKCFFQLPPWATETNDKQPCIEVITTLKQEDETIQESESHSGQHFEYFAEPSEESSKSALAELSLSVEEVPQEIGDTQNARGDDQEANGEEKVNRVVTAAGDQQGSNVWELKELPSENLETFYLNTVKSDPVSESYASVQSVPKPTKDTSNLLFQQYCLDVIVDNISLKKPIKSKSIGIKFKHPKAASVVLMNSKAENRIGEDIILENARCKMFFISTDDHVRKMVYSWPPKLFLTDDQDQTLTEELDIYTALFLSKKRYDCSYITECKAIRTYESLAKISITMYLQEYGLSAFTDQTEFLLTPPILDEQIAIEELVDLQKWKDKQKAQYTADLKWQQKQQLASLQEEWCEKKKQMEEKLTKSVIKCETITIELQNAMNALRAKKAIEQKEEEMRLKEDCELQDIVEKNTLKFAESDPSLLISTVSKLEYDNQHLKRTIDGQRIEMEQVKKTALTKEQTTNLLQQLRGLEEKFHDAQKSKTYFKDQWKKAVREIHDLKFEDQKQMQQRIQSQKIELSQLSLESFLSDRTGVRNFSSMSNVFSTETFK
ncbi:hypothetical protein RI129_010456 [Pyrocoelia pectoralis]|uniref:DUF3668 domain-containing protein n=1 Tax=Pyrocoelia pectoralis TaxID=417401 RepID=A0AAN7VDG7_9COLE